MKMTSRERDKAMAQAREKRENDQERKGIPPAEEPGIVEQIVDKVSATASAVGNAVKTAADVIRGKDEPSFTAVSKLPRKKRKTKS